MKKIPGTEEDIEADLIVSAIGQAVDFTGLESLNNGKGAIAADKNYQVQGQPGMFVRRRRGAPAPADHRHRPRRHRRRRHRPPPAQRGAGQAAEDRRAQLRPHAQDGREGPARSRRSKSRPGAPTRSTGAIHNYDNRSDRYVIPHNELFLGHFNYTPRNRRKIVSLTAEEALSNFEERLLPLLEAQAQAEAKRCMSCGQCFECDNCVVYCPQTAVFKVPKTQVDHRPLCRHRLHQVHRLPHLQGRVPHRLHPDGPRGSSHPRCAFGASPGGDCGPASRSAASLGARGCRAVLAAASRGDGRTPSRWSRRPAPARSAWRTRASMRRNHMDLLKHQRDDTVHGGIRGAKYQPEGLHRLPRQPARPAA